MTKKQTKQPAAPVSMKPRRGGSVTVDDKGKEIKRTEPTLPLDHPEHAGKAKPTESAVVVSSEKEKEPGNG